MNGIETGKLSEDEFKSKDVKDQLWILYRAQERTQNKIDLQPSKCAIQVESCQSQFVAKDWFRSKLAFISGFSAGFGVVGVVVFLKIIGAL